MKTKVILLAVLSSLFLCGCITEFEATGIDEIAGVLVVEGFISDGESTIVLSRSAGLNHDDTQDISVYQVSDAKVYVECDDGAQWEAEFQSDWEWEFGRGHGSRYTIETVQLNPERQYRLKIELDAHEYCTEFSYPMNTPEIDSVFWTKSASGQPVNIHVATHAPDGMAQYYRWSYREDWQTLTREILPGREDLPVMCSKKYLSQEILLGTNEQTAFGQAFARIAEIPPTSDRFMFLYRIDVTQNEVSKRAYDYYTNIQKNSQQAGGIFARIPSEIKGNITCITDSARTVIGYIDVSSATRGRLYISREYVYEPMIQECNPRPWGMYLPIPENYIRYSFPPLEIIELRCVDCIADGGRTINELPDDWPYQYATDD